MRFKEYVLHSAQGEQSVFNGQSSLGEVFGISQALRCNRNDRRQRVFYAMMQLLEQQTLQSFGCLTFCGISLLLVGAPGAVLAPTVCWPRSGCDPTVWRARR